MIIKSVNLETVCGVNTVIPENDKPEVAFAGKSNVGKSSLINSLVNRKSLAKVSSQPGKTQTINYYNINDVLYFVDLPGYGYAKTSAELREQWGKMVDRYLMTSKQLKMIFLLVDIRHEPSENDKQMYEWMKYYGFKPIIIATKMDKINRSQISRQAAMIRKSMGAGPETEIIPFSSVTKQGREEIWNHIESVCGLYD